MTMLRRMIPWSLVALRVLLCPLILFGARHRWTGILLAVIVLVALVSDIYDGVLARRWGSETPALRVSDSIADTIFYLGVAGALWMLKPDVIRNNTFWLGCLFALEGFRYIFDICRYRKPASYHSYLAKLWGIVLAVAMIGVFAFAGSEILVRIALGVGIAVNMEGIAMSAMLPRWKNDVKTLSRAWTIRKSMLSETTARS
jgi:phosphatidylglycerophosphate synthase